VTRLGVVLEHCDADRLAEPATGVGRIRTDPVNDARGGPLLGENLGGSSRNHASTELDDVGSPNIRRPKEGAEDALVGPAIRESSGEYPCDLAGVFVTGEAKLVASRKGYRRRQRIAKVAAHDELHGSIFLLKG
jgi:hypothetical protein